MSKIAVATQAMAAVYTWDCVIAILEGGADPGRLDAKSRKDVDRIIQIAQAAQKRALVTHDRAVGQIDAARKEQQA